MRLLRTALLLLAALLPRLAGAEHVVHARIDRDSEEYTLHADLTYERIHTLDVTLLTRRGLQGFDRTAETFYPDKQALELREAWVDQPDGSRLVVPAGAIFTRPSAASQSAPGFVNAQTTTVLFPQLREGSRIHAVWKFTQKVPALLGFNVVNNASFEWDAVRDETSITAPADLPLHWAKRGEVDVQERVEGGQRRIVARMPQVQAQEAEPGMVSPADFQPMFAATSLASAQQIGAIIDRGSAGRAEVTPEIAALAARIVGERSGLEAARAIHAWVVANIRYVAVYLSPDDGYIPHKAAEVLKAGYGDCKDYTVIMQALLAARGIRAEATIIDWGSRYADPPLITAYFANHEIIYLPDFDLYVNPTDRYARFEALDRRLSGKVVVRVTPEGILARTPASTPAANRYRYRAQLTLDKDGTLHGTADYAMSPNMETAARHALTAVTSMDQLADYMLGRTMEGGFGTLVASDPRDLLQPLQVTARWDSPMAVNPQGQEIFLRVPAGMDFNPPADMRARLSPKRERRTPVLADAIDLGWQTRIALPPGMRAARLPDDVTLSTPVGRYEARYAVRDGAVEVTRNLVIAQDVVQPADYPALQKLLYAPLVDYRAVLVLAPVAE